MADNPVQFSVVLHSATEVCTHTLCVPAVPETVGDLQRHIETKFSVPRCCQSVAFEGITLHRDDSLRAHSARSGDTFHVHYKSEGDVEEIRNVVDRMQKTLILTDTYYNNFPDYYHPEREFCREKVRSLLRVFEQHISHETIESLATHYFQPFASDRTMANKLFFIDIDGLKVLHKLYTNAVKYPWDVTVVTLQRVEQAILRVLWNITATFNIQSQLLRYPTLELCVRSALRVPIEYRKRVVPPQHLAYYRAPSPTADQEFFLCENLYKAAGVLFNLAELPQYQVQIAAEAGLLNQAILLALCPSYYRIASMVTISGMVCLAYNTETHQYLVEENILERVQELTKPMEGDLDEAGDTMKQDLLGYFMVLLYALIMASSVHLIPEAVLNNMCSFVNDILPTADPQRLHQAEQKNGYVWSTLRPHFNLAYTPVSAHLPKVVLEIPHFQIRSFFEFWDIDDDGPVALTDDLILLYPVSLQRLCAEVGILSLQNMLLGEETRQVLLKEKLLDFVICMPWSLPQGSRPQKRACELVKSLGNFMKLEPPSLANIARARLAANTFGLERVINAYSVHDLIHS